MTSTNFNVGLNTDSKMTSRVLKPPGGGHTDIFGACEPEPPRARKHVASTIVLGTENDEKPTNGTTHKPVTPTDTNDNKTEAAAEPKLDNQPKPAQSQQAEAPKRVRVPPGGFSSGLW